jgi:HD-like signal output (HDOD) protein
VINSAYFGMPRTITDPTEAVGLLGFETVKSLIMTVKLLTQYDKVKPVYFSIDSIWRHSTNVARTARVMALLETGDNECSATAYTAGLMHDLGKVILAANFDEQYQGAHTVARRQQVPLWEVEKDIFGASHGEIGAYLLGLWGMSAGVVQVAALHHNPLGAGDTGFTPLTAVHVANALEYEGTTPTDELPVAVLDATYLRQLKLEERVDLWRSAKSDPGAAKFESLLQRSKSTAKPFNPTPAAAAKPQATKFTPAASRSERPAIGGLWKWVGIGLAVTAALAVLARLEVMRLENGEDKSGVEAAAVNPPATVKKDVAAVGAPAKAVEHTKPAPTNHVASAPSTNVASARTNHVAPEMAAKSPAIPIQVPSALPPPAAAKTGLDMLKLQAIFFSSQHPSALISGKLAGLNDEVAECRVLDISPSSVTVEYQHQRKTLTLR